MTDNDVFLFKMKLFVGYLCLVHIAQKNYKVGISILAALEHFSKCKLSNFTW